VIDDHLVELPLLVQRYGTDVRQGLSQDQVILNQNLFGPNKLSPPPVTSEWVNIIISIRFSITPDNANDR
jgi:hypothetical protein